MFNKFVEGIWDYYSKGRNTLQTNYFNKAIFSFLHRWCVHINHVEYENFLLMIYSRITKIKKIYPDGRERIFLPSIKVTLYNEMTKEEFENSTWEFFENEEQLHIKLYKISIIKSNLNNLIINPTYKKAFGNIFNEKLKKIGTHSELWTETIESKIEKIFKTKFSLVHIKLLNLNLSYSLFESNIEVIQNEISEKKQQSLSERLEDLKYFEKFKSKNGIKFDNWDSDNDLYDEANKKSPVVLIIGPPRIGKTQVSMKLAKDLEMEILEPF